MRVGSILLFVHLAGAAVVEKVLPLIGMGETQAHLYNGIKKSTGWHLRNGASGSVVNFVNKNKEQDEWSFEMQIEVPKTLHPEFAGIYLWYTDSPITHGVYKGAQGKFSGVMAGIEFLGKAVDIVVSVNHGEEDYSKYKTEDTELKDSPDPNIFRGHKEIILKVISTSKNFKIEIYGEDHNLIYDRVRYSAMTEIGTRLSGKYFGITTEYHEAKTSSAIVVKSVHMSSREEGESYDPGYMHSEIPEIKPRLPHQINAGSEEIQHTISFIEHLSKYLRVVLGEPLAKPVTQNLLYLKKMINFQSAHILEIRDALKALATISKKHSDIEEMQRNEIIQIARGLHKQISEMRKIAEEPKKEGLSGVTIAGICGMSFIAGYLVSQRLYGAQKIALR